jgi:hypothetical protein
VKTLPHTRRAAHPFDLLGALLAGACLGLFIMGIGSAAHHEPPQLVSIEIVSAMLLGWVLICRQAGSPAPVPPIDPPSQAAFRVVHCYRSLLVRRPGLGFRLPAALLRGHSWPVAGPDRLFPDPLASCGGHHGTDCGRSVRPPSRGNSRRPRPGIAWPGMALFGGASDEPACRRRMRGEFPASGRDFAKRRLSFQLLGLF